MGYWESVWRCEIITFYCLDQRIRSLSYLASDTIVIPSVVDTDLHHYIGDEGVSNFSQIMAIVSCDLKHVYSIFAVLRLAFDFASIYFKRKNR